MTRLISDILRAAEPGFTHEIARLEKLAGHPKVDIRLTNELITRWQELANELGLDGNDTQPRELYFALQKKALEENRQLSKSLGIADSDSVDEMIKKCIDYVQKHIKPKPVWALKISVLKEHLKKNPPKRVLKALGLRSIDSAIKREPIDQIVLLALKMEPKTWREQFITQAAKLKTVDFDRRSIEISTISSKRYDRIRKSVNLDRLIYKNEETASIIVVLPKSRFRGDVLYFVDGLYREQNQIRLWSAFAKYLSVKPNFGQWLSHIRANGFEHTALQHFNFGWSPMHRMLQARSSQDKPALFEPHLDHDDVQLTPNDFDPVWRHVYLLKLDDQAVISCNISDIIVNAVNGYEPDQGSSVYGRRELYNELFARYLNHEKILEEFLSR